MFIHHGQQGNRPAAILPRPVNQTSSHLPSLHFGQTCIAPYIAPRPKYQSNLPMANPRNLTLASARTLLCACLAAPACLLMLALAGCSSAKTDQSAADAVGTQPAIKATAPSPAPAPTAAPAPVRSSQSVPDRRPPTIAGIINAKCPMLGAVPSAAITSAYGQGKVGFCCEGCKASFDRLSDAEKAKAVTASMGS